MESEIEVSRQHGTHLESVSVGRGSNSERKRKEKAFRERLRAVMERDREILERLAD